MNATQVADALGFKKELLLVCDANGYIQAASPEAAEQTTGANPIQRHFSDIFEPGSKLNEWFSEQVDKAKGQDEFLASSSIESLNARVSIASLKRDGELFGYALHIQPETAASSSNNLQDGDAIVYQQQWHDIKNQVGAMKLYATYLMRKMPDGEDRRTVEKMLNGINSLIDHMAKIRRGDAQ